MPARELLSDSESPLICADSEAELTAFPVNTAAGHQYPGGTIGVVKTAPNAVPDYWYLDRGSQAGLSSTVLPTVPSTAGRWRFLDMLPLDNSNADMYFNNDQQDLTKDDAYHTLIGYTGSNTIASGITVNLAAGTFTVDAGHAGRYELNFNATILSSGGDGSAVRMEVRLIVGGVEILGTKRKTVINDSSLEGVISVPICAPIDLADGAVTAAQFYCGSEGGGGMGVGVNDGSFSIKRIGN